MNLVHIANLRNRRDATRLGSTVICLVIESTAETRPWKGMPKKELAVEASRLEPTSWIIAESIAKHNGIEDIMGIGLDATSLA